MDVPRGGSTDRWRAAGGVGNGSVYTFDGGLIEGGFDIWLRGTSGPTRRGTGRLEDVEAAGGDGESVTNSLDLIFGFFVPALGFSGLDNCDAVFPFPLPRRTVAPLWNMFPTGTSFFSLSLSSSSYSGRKPVSSSTLSGRLRDWLFGVGVDGSGDDKRIVIFSATVASSGDDVMTVMSSAAVALWDFI